MFTKTFIAILTVFVPVLAWADCRVYACYAVSLATDSCEFRKSDKKHDIGHVYLKGTVTNATEVRCMAEKAPEGQHFEPRKKMASQTFFAYRAYNASACEAFVGKTVRMFVPDQCCDTIPHRGDCNISDAILLNDLPPQAQAK